MSFPSGARLGAYEVLAPLGAGGMGEVLRARDTRLGREVAVKVLPERLAKDADARARFEREARAVAALSHPNIVGLLDVGESEGTFFAVMELLDGETLRERLSSGALPQRKAVEIAREIATGLAAAHERGIVHRDLKPENVFLTRDGRVKLLDFGLAKASLELEKDVSSAPTLVQTEPGTVMGTVGYMSPEQVRGKRLDHRTDLFSFGSVLYEMLAGHRAFSGGSAVETMNAILASEPAEIAGFSRGVSPGLERIVRRCLEKAPEQRFQSARDLAFALENLGSATDASGRLAPAPFVGGRRAWLLAVAAVLAVLVFFGGRASKRGWVELPRFTPLSFSNEPVLSARFTKDGRSVVYTSASEDFGSSSIQVLTLGDPLPRKLFDVDAYLLGVSAKDELAVLSTPERTRIDVRRGSLARCPLGGALPRIVSQKVMYADWSPDGASIAVARFTPTNVGQLEYPEGKVLRRIEGGWFSHPRFSPDGKWLAVLEHPKTFDDMGFLTVVESATGEARRLSGPWASIQGLAWRPDRGEIWFTAAKASIDLELLATDLGGKLRRVSSAPAGLKLEDIGRDGRVLLTRVEKVREPFSYVVGSPAPRPLPIRGFARLRSLSIDGRFAIIEDQSESLGPSYPMYFVPTDGSLPTPLGTASAAALSDDATKAALLRKEGGATPVVIVPPAGGAETAIETKGLDVRYLLFKGNDLLGLASEGGSAAPRIWKLAAGSAPVPLGPELPGAVVLSGRGLKGGLVLVGFASGEARLVDVDDPRSTPRDFPGLGYPFGKYRLLGIADGESLLVARQRDLPFDVERLSLATGKLEPFAKLDVPGMRAGFLEGLFLTRDGRYVVGARTRYSARLYLAEGLR